jgi:Fe-S oxidoreductase
MGILDVKEMIRACRYCFMCRYSCPTFMATKRESVTPRGYALLMMASEDQKQDWTDDILSAFYQCTLCGLGRERCEFNWAEDDMVRNARAEIVSTNHAPQVVKSTADKFLLNPKTRTNNDSLPMDKQGAQVLYLAGCQTHEHTPEIISATARVFKAADIDWTMLEEESCCGGGLYDLGYFPEARQKASELAGKITALNPAKIVTGCAHCFRTLKEFFPAWETNLPAGIQVLHMTEFLNQMIIDGKIKMNGSPKEGKLGYHDPCMLGRKMGVYDAPRNVIQAVSGSTPIELFHNRELAECCGAGSVTHSIESDVARKVAGIRLERATEAGTNVLVTACQNCKMILQKTSEDKKVEILDIVELVARNLD